MNPGIYDGLTNAEYHGGEGVSKSMFDTMAGSSPLHLHYNRTYANDNEKPPSQAFVIGTAFHALLLEPKEFTRTYCLALRPQDVPEAVEGKDQLLAMVAELNASRLPKLSTSGSKDELAQRILDELTRDAPITDAEADRIDQMKASELKTEIARLNEARTGLLPVTGTMEALAQILRDAGRSVTLWQDVKAEWLENNAGRIILKQDDWDMLHQMSDAVAAHPMACALIYGVPGKAEQSVYWNDPVTGVLCRCRPDWWRQDNVVVDVKTTDGASPDGFAHSVASYRYHVQDAFYTDGIREACRQAKHLPGWLKQTGAPRFVFLAVEKGARVVNGSAMGVAVYMLDNQPAENADPAQLENITSVDLGRALYRRDLSLYAACLHSGDWRGYGDKVTPLRLPGYEFTRNKHLFAA